MTAFALVRQSDAVVASILYVDSLDNLVLNLPDGHDIRSCDDLPVVPGEWHWSGETLAPIPPAPPSLTRLRAEQWQQVKGLRDRAEWAGCMTQLGRVDTDPDSQRKVSGSVQMAMIAQAAGAPFDLAWTMQDNRTVMHDAGAMVAMGVAVGQHVAACHAVALAKRAMIDAAVTVEAIEAVDIEGGWPDAAVA